MSIASRLVIVALCLIATQFPAWQLERQTNQAARQARLFDASSMPMRIGPWTGADTEIDQKLIRHVGALSTVNRAYDGGPGRQVLVHVASFPAARISLPHPPPLCYRSAGWTIVSEEWVHPEGMPKHRRMVVDREGTQAIVEYWYQLGDLAAAERGDLRLAVQKLRWKGERWPPLVKVLLHVPVVLSADDSQGDAREIGSAVYDWVRAES
jgi:hypothetical protein